MVVLLQSRVTSFNNSIFKIDNFPVGLSIIGPLWSDKKVLEIGAFLERQRK